MLLVGRAPKALAQEATSGFTLGTTISGVTLYSPALSSPPRNGDDVTGAFRAVLYPTWKVSHHWAFSGAVEAYSHPYFFEDFSNTTTGTSVQILHADVSYARFWENRSVVFRAGQLSSGFGSFLLRYDDAVNPLIDVPMSYGYYMRGVSTNSLAGVGVGQVFLGLGRQDGLARSRDSTWSDFVSVKNCKGGLSGWKRCGVTLQTVPGKRRYRRSAILATKWTVAHFARPAFQTSA